MTGGAARGSAPLLAAAIALGGCAPVEAELDGASRIARYATHYDHVLGPQANLVDRALAGCGVKTAKAEAACLRAAIEAERPSVEAMAASIPGCRPGRVCTYDHATRDRLGLVEASATDYVKRWRVTLDLRRPAGGAAAAPLTVADRDDFDGEPAAAP